MFNGFYLAKLNGRQKLGVPQIAQIAQIFFAIECPTSANLTAAVQAVNRGDLWGNFKHFLSFPIFSSCRVVLRCRTALYSIGRVKGQNFQTQKKPQEPGKAFGACEISIWFRINPESEPSESNFYLDQSAELGTNHFEPEWSESPIFLPYWVCPRFGNR